MSAFIQTEMYKYRHPSQGYEFFSCAPDVLQTVFAAKRSSSPHLALDCLLSLWTKMCAIITAKTVSSHHRRGRAHTNRIYPPYWHMQVFCSPPNTAYTPTCEWRFFESWQTTQTREQYKVKRHFSCCAESPCPSASCYKANNNRRRSGYT